tara:strand:+ start:565 stop:717 length:153 start_codon:yes stop_codon:yes gene_type:complete
LPNYREFAKVLAALQTLDKDKMMNIKNYRLPGDNGSGGDDEAEKKPSVTK